jgi:hypothetical protein
MVWKPMSKAKSASRARPSQPASGGAPLGPGSLSVCVAGETRHSLRFQLPFGKRVSEKSALLPKLLELRGLSLNECCWPPGHGG